MTSRLKLKDEQRQWRDMVCISAGQLRGTFKVDGPVALVLIFQSPKWITNDFKVRQVDVDNYIKPTCDGIEVALRLPDEINFQVHAFKSLSTKERTLVYLFDLGRLVDYHILE